MHLTTKELRKLLNKAWGKGFYRDSPDWYNKLEIRRARYGDVSKILEEAETVDWSKLNTPDNVEAKP